MKRRAKGEGTITKLPSGRWRARVTLADGKRLSKTADRKDDISEWLRQTNDQADQGLTFDGARTTTGEYLLSWLGSKKNSIRPTTYNGYKNVIQTHLIPAFGKILIKDLTSDKVQAIYDLWAKKIGAATQVKVADVFYQVMERAKVTGLISRNPCESVSRPHYQHDEMKFWTEADANRFLAAAQKSRLYALFHLALVTGARQGELLGLKWTDIDFSACSVRFRRQLTPDGRFAPIKTKAGNRTLNVGQQNMAVLRDHYNLQQKERQFAGDKWQETGLVFTSMIGTRVHHHSMIKYQFHPVIEAAGVPKIRFHDLRHTCVAMLISKNTPIYVISKWLGHARTSITSDIYGHLVPNAFDGVGEMLHEMVTPVEIDVPYGHDKDTESIESDNQKK